MKELANLVENDKIVSDKSKLVEIFNKHFGNIVQNLGIDALTKIMTMITIRKAQRNIKIIIM